LICYS